VVAAAGGAFVATAIAREWRVVRSSLADAEAGWLVAGLALAGAAMVAIAIPWRRALALVGVESNRAATVVWYFLGEIGKYIPGGLWPVVGRAELARRGGLPRAASYASVALSLGALYLAAMLLVAGLAPFAITDDGGDTGALWLLLLLPAGLGLLHHRPLGWMLGRAERLLRRRLAVRIPPWSAAVGLVTRYLPAWVLVGTATWCIARALEPGVSWLAVAPAAVLSWVVGFLSVPVPGGVGVREAAFVALVSALPDGIGATTAVVARLSFMAVDACGAALGALTWRRWRPRVPATPQL
jgi:glycosyltransferase 2 family protein